MTRLGLRRRDEAPAAPASNERAAPAAESRPRLGELLVARRAVSREALERALSGLEQGVRRLGEVLLDQGLVDDAQLLDALAEQHDVDAVDLPARTPSAEAVALVPADLARRLRAVPLEVDADDGTLVVATSEPTADVARALVQAAGRPVQLLAATDRAVERALDQTYRALDDVSGFVQAFVATAATRKAATQAEDVVDSAPVVQVVQKLLVQALRDRASDVHLEPQGERLRVRFRVDGVLHEVLTLPAEMAPAVTSRIKIMASMNIVERRRPQDGQIATEIDGRPVDIRVSTTGTIFGEKTVLRVLDKSRSLRRLDQLGYAPQTHEQLSRMIRSPFGMVLCAGPTGSGKTTSLYAALSEIDTANRNIMTIEDPVEYVFPSVNQIQTNEQAGLTFATGLRSILRQDPDVVLVGEIRDVETARIATQAALTGHFVLSSLHATDAVSALHRFLDMGIESFLIASSVIGVVGQRLVRRVCPHCARAKRATAEEKEFLAESGVELLPSYRHGVGCGWCSGTGYSERVGIYELLPVTSEVKRLVVGWATQEELRRLAQKQGMRTLRDEVVDLVQRGVTTVDEAVRTVYAAV